MSSQNGEKWDFVLQILDYKCNIDKETYLCGVYGSVFYGVYIL